MNNGNTAKVVHAKELIGEAINNYKQALDKLSKNESDEIKQIRRKIEDEIDRLKKIKIKLDNIN